MPGIQLSVDLLTKPIMVASSWETFCQAVGLQEFKTERENKVADGCLKGVMILSRVLMSDGINKVTRVASAVGLSTLVACLHVDSSHQLGRMRGDPNSTLEKDLKRARSKATVGPEAATTTAEAPLEGGVEIRKVLGKHEPTPAFHIKALRSSGPQQVAGHGAEAMANSKPFGPPFDFWPVSDDQFNEPPMVGKDRWTALQNGWWIKEHREWRVRSFTPAHRNVPFSMHDLSSDRFTMTFWRGSTGGWLQQVHHDSWIDPPRDMLPKDSRTGRSPQWLGFSFFKLKEVEAGAGSSGDRRVPGDFVRGDNPAGHRDQRFDVFDFRWQPPQGGGESIEIRSQPSDAGSDHGFEMIEE